MTRIATMGSNQVLTNQLMSLQIQVNTDNLQTSSKMKSQNYAGISAQSFQVVDLQNKSSSLQNYMQNNTTAQTLITVQTTQVTGVQSAVSDFRTALTQYTSGNLKDPAAVAAVQNAAIAAMSSMSDMLNSNVGGSYLFSGGKTDIQPVNLPAPTLAQFQTMYPGGPVATVKSVNGVPPTPTTGATFPVTRAQQLGSINLNTSLYGAGTVSYAYTEPAGVPTLTATAAVATAQYGTASFSSTGGATGNTGTISTTNTAWYNTLQPGSTTSNTMEPGTTFTFSDPGQPNDGTTFTVVSNSGTTLTVSPPPTTCTSTTGTFAPDVFASLPIGATVTVGGATAASTIVAPPNAAASSGNVINFLTTPQGLAPGAAPTTLSATEPNNYYDGDQMQVSHQVDPETTITLGVNSTNPAFEKAFRAMGMIAQGNLANNPARVQVVLNLLGNTLDGTPVTGEQNGGFADVSQTLGTNAVSLNTADTNDQSYQSFLDTQVQNMTEVDPVAAVAQLQNDTTALQVAMKALASITNLSLLTYMP